MSEPPILDYRRANDPQPQSPIHPKERVPVAKALRMIATSIIFLAGAIIVATGNRDVEVIGGLTMFVAGVMFCYQLFVGL
jgi:hypothetical protein